MKSHNVILKFDEFSLSTRYSLRKIEGTINAESMIRLIDIADLHANPREAKTGAVTDAITETLDTSPDLFQFKSKGILLASANCRELERSRFEISFHDEDIEGVLDGGHNMLAIAMHILRQGLGEKESRKALRSVRRWEEVAEVWAKYRTEIDDVKKDLNFFVPMEIIYPQDSAEGRDAYESAILEIAQARNNNAQLTDETKANKAGYYDAIRDSIDPNLVSEVEWKTNDGGRIKARDLVALTWIPLSALPESLNLPGVNGFNPVNIYRNKGYCVSAFNTLMQSDEVSKKTKGDIRELHHPAVISAIGMMRDLPQLFDFVYGLFPDAYNDVSPGFGRISSVRIFENGKYNAKEKKYLAAPAKTKFYQADAKFDFPEGFIAPVVWALRELMEFKAGELVWKTDPRKFLESNLRKFMQVYHGFISMANYDPQKVGKTNSTYQLACNDFKSRLK
ncbi:MAG: hypothetical protein WC213_02055 [Arenimonas sp.]